MQILLTKRGSNNADNKIESVKMLDYDILVNNNNNLFLVQEGTMTIDDKTNIDAPLYEIFKVQFIASCKTDLGKGLIVAFYLGEYSYLEAYALDGIPDGYYQDGDDKTLIDYKAYLELCELSGESKLNLIDYIKEKKSGNISVNTFIEQDGKFLNRDQQQALWNEIDKKNETV